MSFHLKDFADMAVAIERLDLVISVDTSVAHLAGAMAKQVWTLLSYCLDCRWMLERDDSPWYPTMRLYRQSRPKRWDDLMTRVRADLESKLANVGAMWPRMVSAAR